MKVSIIITCFNYGKYLERCLRSCLSQNFPKDDYEVIVVDDCSTDETSVILKNFEGIPNFRYHINKKNLGVAGSANEGIRLARGQYVVRVDADDYVSRNFILFLSEYLMVNHDAFCVSCDYIYVDEMENKLERIYASEKPVSCGIMYRKDALIEHGMYNDEWRHREEEELRKRLGSRYRIHHMRMPFYRYRMHKSNKTKQSDNMEIFRQKLADFEAMDNPMINLEQTSEQRPLDENVIVVIPARGGSQRLPGKNIYPVWGKPMLYWAVKAAQESRYVKNVYVSTEDTAIAAVAREFGCDIIDRPLKLAEGAVFKQDVICHATRVVTESSGRKPTIVVSLQANSPQVCAQHIDSAIDQLIKHRLQEVMSANRDMIQNAALRVMTYNAVFQKSLSTHCGFMIADLIDVHTKQDVEALEKAGKSEGTVTCKK